MSDKKIKLTNSVEYKELYKNLEDKIIGWEKNNLGNPYFHKFKSPVVKNLNTELHQDFVLLHKDGTVSIAAPLGYLNIDVSKWKNVKSLINKVALTEEGKVFSADIENRMFKDSDFSDWSNVKEIFKVSDEVIALQTDGKICWRANNEIDNQDIVKETLTWENIKDIYIFDGAEALVFAAVNFNGEILISGCEELKQKLSGLSISPIKIVFLSKTDIIALYEDGHLECTFKNELSEKIKSFHNITNICRTESFYFSIFLIVQKDTATILTFSDDALTDIKTVDIPFDDITIRHDIWPSPIQVIKGNKKTYYCLKNTTEGIKLEPFEDMNRLAWEDFSGVAYEKGMHIIVFIKSDGTLISTLNDEYVKTICNVEEATPINSSIVVLTRNKDLEFHNSLKRQKYLSISNCKKFLILNPLAPYGKRETTQHVFVLHDETLSIYAIGLNLSAPELCGKFDGVKNIFTSPDGNTICIRFLNGRLKTFGEHLFDSDIDFEGAAIYYYGPLLEDGAMKLQGKYSRNDHSDDRRDIYTGIFGLQKNGKCFVLSNQNWFSDSLWQINIHSLMLMENTEDVIEICPSRFLYVNKDNELRSFCYLLKYSNVSSCSASIYYEVCVHCNGVIDGVRDANYGCCKFDGIGEVEKALAFAMGTVVLTTDGKLKSLCNKKSECAYESLPVKTKIKDILRNYSIFAILCENGDLYACDTQKGVCYNSGFEKKPFTQWQLIMKGVERLETCGEETFAIVSENAETLVDLPKNPVGKWELMVARETSYVDFKIHNGCLEKYTGACGSVIIPDCVTNIGVSAFSSCEGLESIKIPNSVEIIDKYAFSNCQHLKDVVIPHSVKEIRDYSFQGCNALTSIVIPGSVNRIKNYAFSKCETLETVIIQDGVTDIGTCAFSACPNLKSVTIPDSVEEIGWDPFDGCDNLTIYAPAYSGAEDYAIENDIPFVANKD